MSLVAEGLSKEQREELKANLEKERLAYLKAKQEQHFILAMAPKNISSIVNALEGKVVDKRYGVVTKKVIPNMYAAQIVRKGACLAGDRLGVKLLSCETQVLYKLMGKEVSLENLSYPVTAVSEFDYFMTHYIRIEKQRFAILQHSMNFSYVAAGQEFGEEKIFVARGLGTSKPLATKVIKDERGIINFRNDLYGTSALEKTTDIISIGGVTDGCLGLWYGKSKEGEFYLASNPELLTSLGVEALEFPYGCNAVINSYQQPVFFDNESERQVEPDYSKGKVITQPVSGD